MTDATMTVAEIAAGTAALKAMIASKLPKWEQAMVPDGILGEAVQAVVAAVDKVRDDAAATR